MSVVVITGCSSGIGKLAAIQLARLGDQVFAGVRDLSRATDLIEVAANGLPNLEIVSLDVTNLASIRLSMELILHQAGRIDALVNNAGILVAGPVEEISEERLVEVFDTNVFGVFRMIQAVLPTMRSHSSGVIVNISSIGATWPLPFRAAYGATKHAVHALSSALSDEIAEHGIRVVLVESGTVATDLFKKVARNSKPQDSVYGPAESRFFQDLAKLQSRLRVTGDPQEVVDAIIAGVHDSASRRHYVVGRDAQVLGTLRRRLDDDAFNWIVRDLLNR